MRRSSARPGTPLAGALLVGAFAALVAGAQVGVPALWRDEAATIGAASRSWTGLGILIGHVDVVHAVYYAAMHGWTAVAGISPVAVRLPSVAAAGCCAVLCAVLGGRLGGRAAGFAAGLAAAVLPSLVWAGGEGRSYALTAVAAASATLALLHALAPHRTAARTAIAWIAHAALLALGAALFLDLLLLGLAHAVTAALLGRGPRRLLGVASAAAAGLAVAPLIRAASNQTAQVDWIPDYAPPTPWHQLEVEQWFRSDAVAIAVGAVLLVGGVAALLRRRPGAGRVAAVLLPWALVPPAALLAAGLVHTPLYWPRYVTFGAPAVAVLVGIAAASLPRPLGAVALALVAALAVPQIAADRQPRAKAVTELGLAAALVTRARSPADGRAGILYGQYDGIVGMTTRVESIAYPEAFTGLRDLALRGSLDRSPSLWGEDVATATAVRRAAGLDTVWVLLDADASPRTFVPVRELTALGFTRSARFTTPGTRLERWSR